MEHETYLERIKKLKSTQKITNEKLAELTGIPLGTLSKLLAGISDSPKLVNMVAISQALGCSLDYLITGEPENTNNYTLTPAEITMVETFRALDDYGQTLTSLVLNREYERSRNQAAEAAIRRHDEARAAGRSLRGRRRTAGAATTDAPSAEVVLTTGEGAPAGVTSPAATILSVPTASTVPTAPAAPIAPIASVTSAPTAGAPVRPPVRRTATGLGHRPVLLYDLAVSAGVGEFLSDDRGTQILIPNNPRTQEADCALRISGDSMEPKYHNGDVLLVQHCEGVEEGELGIFVLDGAGYFKKYGGDRLISLNPAYAPIMLKDFAESTCVGRVVGKLKRK